MKLNSAPRAYNQRARAQSSEATARRIVDAFLAELMGHWYDEITLDRIAENADVTVQTIVRRFGGKEGLLAETVKTLAKQIHARRSTPSGDIDRLVDNLITDYEYTGDTVIRLLALEPRYPALQQILRFGRREHRDWVENALADALARCNRASRKTALDALVISTDVYTWKLLRRDMGQSVAAAARTMKFLILSAINRLPKLHSTN